MDISIENINSWWGILAVVVLAVGVATAVAFAGGSQPTHSEDPLTHEQPTVDGAIVSGAQDATTDFDSNVRIAAYNSTTDVSAVTETDGGGRIITSSQLAAHGGDVEIAGEVLAKDTVGFFDQETSLDGTVYCLNGNADCVIDDWGGAVDDGDVVNAATSVETPEPVDERVTTAVETYRDENDNDNVEAVSDNQLDWGDRNRITLSAGQYYFDELEVDDAQQEVILDTTDGNVTVAVDGNVTIEGATLTVKGDGVAHLYADTGASSDSEVTVTDGGAVRVVEDGEERYDPSSLWLFAPQGINAEISQGATFVGVIYAPDGEKAGNITIDSAVVYGGIVGHVTSITGGTDPGAIYYDEALGHDIALSEGEMTDGTVRRSVDEAALEASYPEEIEEVDNSLVLDSVPRARVEWAMSRLENAYVTEENTSAVSNSIRQFNRSVAHYETEFNVNSSEAFDAAQSGVQELDGLSDRQAVNESTLAVSSASRMVAERHAARAEVAIQNAGSVDTTNAQDHYEQAEQHLADAEQILEAGDEQDMVSARADAIEAYGDAWEDADTALELVAENHPPEITLTSTTFQPQKQTVSVRLRGEVRDVKTHELSNVTVLVNGTKHSELDHISSTQPYSTGTFHTTLEVEQLQNNITVTVTDGNQTASDSYVFDAKGYANETFERTYEDNDTGVRIDAVGEGLAPEDVRIIPTTPDHVDLVGPQFYVRDYTDVDNATVEIPIDQSIDHEETTVVMIHADNETSPWHFVRTEVDEEENVARANVDEFSIYGVISVENFEEKTGCSLNEENIPDKRDVALTDLPDGGPIFGDTRTLSTDTDLVETDALPLENSADDGLPDVVQEMNLCMPVGSGDMFARPLNLNPSKADTAEDGVKDGEVVDIEWDIYEQGGDLKIDASVVDAIAHPGTGEPVDRKKIVVQIHSPVLAAVPDSDQVEAGPIIMDYYNNDAKSYVLATETLEEKEVPNYPNIHDNDQDEIYKRVRINATLSATPNVDLREVYFDISSTTSNDGVTESTWVVASPAYVSRGEPITTHAYMSGKFESLAKDPTNLPLHIGQMRYTIKIPNETEDIDTIKEMYNLRGDYSARYNRENLLVTSTSDRQYGIWYKGNWPGLGDEIIETGMETWADLMLEVVAPGHGTVAKAVLIPRYANPSEAPFIEKGVNAITGARGGINDDGEVVRPALEATVPLGEYIQSTEETRARIASNGADPGIPGAPNIHLDSSVGTTTLQSPPSTDETRDITGSILGKDRGRYWQQPDDPTEEISVSMITEQFYIDLFSDPEKLIGENEQLRSDMQTKITIDSEIPQEVDQTIYSSSSNILVIEGSGAAETTPYNDVGVRMIYQRDDEIETVTYQAWNVWQKSFHEDGTEDIMLVNLESSLSTDRENPESLLPIDKWDAVHIELVHEPSNTLLKSTVLETDEPDVDIRGHRLVDDGKQVTFNIEGVDNEEHQVEWLGPTNMEQLDEEDTTIVRTSQESGTYEFHLEQKGTNGVAQIRVRVTNMTTGVTKTLQSRVFVETPRVDLREDRSK